MEKKRKHAIHMIETKKNAAIHELTTKHAAKYKAIMTYYAEITNTNLDIIRQLKDDLADARKDDNHLRRELRNEADKNAAKKGPYDEAIARCKKLEVDALKHKKIKDEFVSVNEKIEKCKKEYLELEWEFEVKSQQIKYMEKEKAALF